MNAMIPILSFSKFFLKKKVLVLMASPLLLLTPLSSYHPHPVPSSPTPLFLFTLI